MPVPAASLLPVLVFFSRSFISVCIFLLSFSAGFLCWHFSLAYFSECHWRGLHNQVLSKDRENNDAVLIWQLLQCCYSCWNCSCGCFICVWFFICTMYVKSILGGHIVITLYRKNSEKHDMLGLAVNVQIYLCPLHVNIIPSIRDMNNIGYC